MGSSLSWEPSSQLLAGPKIARQVIIIGADGARPGNPPRAYAGESYVVFSTAVPSASATFQARSRNGNAPRVAFGITGDGSNDSTPDGRAWIDFADGNALPAPASSETLTLIRSSGGIPGLGAKVSWRIQTTRSNWTNAQVRFRYLDSELSVDENNLQIFFSPNGQAPFTRLTSQVNAANNTITANITQVGYFFLDSGDRLLQLIYANDFEPGLP